MGQRNYKASNCDWGYRCKKSWDDLVATDTPSERYCSGCDSTVFLCSSRAELEAAATAGRCIAFSERLLPTPLVDSIPAVRRPVLMSQGMVRMMPQSVREAVVYSLRQRRLNKLAVDLGIFDAPAMEEAALREKFLKTRAFGKEALIAFLTLPEKRRVAEMLGIVTERVKGPAIEKLLLKWRKPEQKAFPEIPSCSGLDVPQRNKEQEQPEQRSTSSFSAKDVPPNLFGARWLAMERAEGKLRLVTRKGRKLLREFDSETDARAWHKAFDEYRSLEHHAAISVRGEEGSQRENGTSNIHIDSASSGNSTNDGNSQPTSQRDEKQEEDKPETVYECPVCRGNIRLREAKRHIAEHRRLREVAAHNEDWVRGLLFVAQKAMKTHAEPKTTNKKKPTASANKPHVRQIIEEAKARGKIIGHPGSRSGLNRDKEKLPVFREGSGTDVYARRRVISGGGGPGTGKRR